MKTRRVSIAAALMALLAIVGVSGVRPALAQPATVQSSAGVSDYKLGVSDKVRILVFNEPTLSGEFNVNSNGAIAFPLIGDVKAEGRTTTEVGRDISDRLAEGYLRSPQVSIDVLTFRPFFILGEVNKPGEYPYMNGLTVLQAVATAQGFTYRANKSKVYIKKEGDTSEHEYKVTTATPVAPGDTIRVTERFF
jgi:polysaccharide export outer membrane protein